MSRRWRIGGTGESGAPLSEGEVESNDEDRYVSDDSEDEGGEDDSEHEGGEDDSEDEGGEDERGKEELDLDKRNSVESFAGPEFGSKTTRILNVLLESDSIDTHFWEDIQFSNLNQTLTLMHS